MSMLPAAIAIARHHIARADEDDAKRAARSRESRAGPDDDWSWTDDPCVEPDDVDMSTALQELRSERRERSRERNRSVAIGVFVMIVLPILLIALFSHLGATTSR